jgi:hypothetical protein
MIADSLWWIDCSVQNLWYSNFEVRLKDSGDRVLISLVSAGVVGQQLPCGPKSCQANWARRSIFWVRWWEYLINEMDLGLSHKMRLWSEVCRLAQRKLKVAVISSVWYAFDSESSLWRICQAVGELIVLGTEINAFQTNALVWKTTKSWSNLLQILIFSFESQCLMLCSTFDR